MSAAAELKALMLGEPRLRLAVAESMTCGRVQASIGAISGASEFFLGGITAYSLEQKIRHLGVDRAVAEPVNCVSEEVAKQMAKGAGALFGANVTAATTGYAEPNAAWGVSEPYAWVVVARRADSIWTTFSQRVTCPGATRTEAQERVTAAAIAALVETLQRIRQPFPS